jgi:hypothetical protein
MAVPVGDLFGAIVEADHIDRIGRDRSFQPWSMACVVRRVGSSCLQRATSRAEMCRPRSLA